MKKTLTYYDNGDGKIRLHKLTNQEQDNTLSYIEAPNGKRLKFKYEQILVDLSVPSLLYLNNYYGGSIRDGDEKALCLEVELYKKLYKKFKLTKPNK